MKKFKLLPLFALMGSLLLTGCGSNAEKSNPSEQGPSTSEVTPTKSMLSFLEANQIRFDIMDNIGVSFKYGNADITSQTPLTLASGNQVSFTGTLTADTVNFIVVAEEKAKDGQIGNYSCLINPGIEKDSLAEYLEGFAKDYITPNLGGKMYVAISNGAHEATWTKGLNSDLDAAIQKQIDFFKN